MVTYRYQLTLAAKSRFHEVFYIYTTPTLTQIDRNQSAKFATMILSIKLKGFQRSITSGLPEVRPTEL